LGTLGIPPNRSTSLDPQLQMCFKDLDLSFEEDLEKLEGLFE
jgi:hypothetical protein